MLLLLLLLFQHLARHLARVAAPGCAAQALQGGEEVDEALVAVRRRPPRDAAVQEHGAELADLRGGKGTVD